VHRFVLREVQDLHSRHSGVQRDHVVALLERPDPRSDVHDHPGPFVPEDDGEEALGVRARARELVRVADAGGADLDEHLAGLRAVQLHVDDFERLAGRPGDCSARFHRSRPPLQDICRPPFSEKSAPVAKAASSDASQATMDAISSGVPSLPTGMVPTIAVSTSGFIARTMSVPM